ncbi:MAG: NAD-dependent epimerase [Fulvivirga sp.]
MNKSKILVTGAAGFIGFHLSKVLCNSGHSVVGIDNLNEYYSVELKMDRLAILNELDSFTFEKVSLEEDGRINVIFKEHEFDYVINLAAQAGVRYSLLNPASYINSNLVGFANILEACRKNNIRHLLYASSSSVYGGNKEIPFSVDHSVDHPISLYAASKKSNELMAHTYSHLFGLPTTGLRFFTVYGPYGRPDMALYLFTKAIVEGKPINVYNYGKMKRDFTYIDDIISAVVKLIEKIPQPIEEIRVKKPNPGSSWAPYRIFNIGNNNPIELMNFIETIENALGKKATKNYLEIQPGDMNETYADVNDLENLINFKPSTPIQDGIKKFTDWYKEYYNV